MQRASSRSAGSSSSRNGGQSTRRHSPSASSRASSSRASSSSARRSSAGYSSEQYGASARSSSAYRRAPQRNGAKIGIIVVVVLAVVIGLIVGFYALSRSSVLRIEKIEATGVEHLTADEIEQLAAVPDDASLLTVDEGQIRDNLLQDAWIEDVQVTRVPPNTLRLDITERDVAAVVSIPSSSAKTTRRWAISSDGIWLMPIPDQTSEAGKATSNKVYEDAANALQITDVPYGEQPEIGTVNTNEYVACALDVVTGLTTSLKDQVKSVKASDLQSVTLILDNNIEIVFGNAEDIREKERVCLELMERYPDQISYINVRSVENPTWRSV